MMDLDTFLTTVYVLIDDRCVLPVEPPQPGPAPALTRTQTLTLAIASQWAPFASERAFFRYGRRHLLAAFPHLPSRPQFNRLVRRWHDGLVAVGLQVAAWLDAPQARYQVLDTIGLATRNSQRRGTGWLAGQVDIGYCSRLGWFEPPPHNRVEHVCKVREGLVTAPHEVPREYLLAYRLASDVRDRRREVDKTLAVLALRQPGMERVAEEVEPLVLRRALAVGLKAH